MGQLEDLRAFLLIVERESIGKAADASGIAKSAMSRKLRLLEERLQTELITRTTRRWALTEAGRNYYQKAVSIVGAIDETDAEMASEQTDLRGEIRLSAPLHFGDKVLTKHILDFAEQHPAVHVHLAYDDRLVDLIGEHFDLAIRISNLPDSSMIAKKLGQTRHVFCASPGYLAAAGPLDTPADLQFHRILQVGPLKRFKWTFSRQEGAAESISLGSVLNSNNADLIIDAAARGMGVIRVPDFIAESALGDGRLVRILQGRVPPTLGIYAIFPAGRFLPGRVRRLIEFLSRRLKTG